MVNILINKFHFPKGIESYATYLILTSKDTANVALRLYLMALDEFPDKIKNIIMAHEKTVIESRFLTSQPTKDWEEAWLENINNHGPVVLYAVCQNKDCETRCYPVLMHVNRKHLHRNVNNMVFHLQTHYRDCQFVKQKIDSYNTMLTMRL